MMACHHACMNPDPDRVTLSPEIENRFGVLADQAVTALHRMGARYFNSPSTKPLRQQVDQLKVDSGLTEQQFALKWSQACQVPTYAFQREGEKNRRFLDRFGWIFGGFGLFAGLLMALTYTVPTWVWSGIVCDDPYELETKKLVSIGQRTSRTTEFYCIAAEGVYPVSLWTMLALNAIPTLLLAAVGVGIFMWRRKRKAV